MNHIDVARTGIGKEGIEGFAVALFGRSGEPVRRAKFLSDVDGERNVLSFNRPHRMHEDQLIGAKAKALTFAFSVT